MMEKSANLVTSKLLAKIIDTFDVFLNLICSEFLITVGSVIRTTGILIHSRLKVLAVNLSQPSGHFGCVLA